MTEKNIKLLSVVVILLFAGVLRFSLLSTTYQYPSGEEAFHGLIAKELIEVGKISIKPYAISYAGGSFIEAYLIAVFFKLFGISDVSLKIPIFLLSLISLLLIILLGFKVFGITYGLAWGVIYAFRPIFARWNFTSRGGYVELLIFIPLLTLIFLKIYKNTGFNNIVLFGLVSSVAFWNQPLILSLLLAFSLFLFVLSLNNIFVAVFKAALYIFISVLPRVFIEIFRESSVFRDQFLTSLDFIKIFPKLARVFYFDLPAFLTPNNLDNFPSTVSVIGYVQYLLMIALLFSAILRYTAIFKKGNFIKRILIPKDSVILLFLSAIIIHIIIYSSSKMGGISPRYLLPVGFYGITIISYEITSLLVSKKRIMKAGVICIIFFLFVITVAEHIVMFQEERTITDMGIATNGEDLKKVINFLNGNGYKYVYTNCWLQSRIMFESKGDIIASSDKIFPMVYSYPNAELVVNKADKFAYVVYTIDPFLQILTPRLDKININYSAAKIGDFTVIHNLSRPTRPENIFNEKKYE